MLFESDNDFKLLANCIKITWSRTYWGETDMFNMATNSEQYNHNYQPQASNKVARSIKSFFSGQNTMVQLKHLRREKSLLIV